MTGITFAPAARQDLADIWLYTADTRGTDRADGYVRRIEADAERLLDFPVIGSLLAGHPLTYRKIASGSHRVIYRVADDEVIVVRVLHERQDVPDEIEDFW